MGYITCMQIYKLNISNFWNLNFQRPTLIIYARSQQTTIHRPNLLCSLFFCFSATLQLRIVFIFSKHCLKKKKICDQNQTWIAKSKIFIYYLDLYSTNLLTHIDLWFFSSDFFLDLELSRHHGEHGIPLPLLGCQDGDFFVLDNGTSVRALGLGSVLGRGKVIMG